MDAEGKLEAALDALERASTVFVKVCFLHLLVWVEEMPTLPVFFTTFLYVCILISIFILSADKNIIFVNPINVM
jgi:hypothetical protein